MIVSKVIAAEGEHKASRALRHAAEVIIDSPAALQVHLFLRNTDTDKDTERHKHRPTQTHRRTTCFRSDQNPEDSIFCSSRWRDFHALPAEAKQHCHSPSSPAPPTSPSSSLSFQLRYLQTLNSISAENNSTIIFPVPIDIISEMIGKVDTPQQIVARLCS